MRKIPGITKELQTAAMIADHGYKNQTPDPKINLQTVVEILKRNQVPLLGLFEPESGAGSQFIQNGPLHEIIEADYQNWQQQRNEYRLVVESLKEQDVACVLIKSVGLAPSFPYTSDNVDMMVKINQLSQARDVLIQQGYVEFPHIEEPLKFLFRKYVGGQSVSAIHLHGQVGWGVPFILDDELWDRTELSRDDALVTVPSAEDSLMITMAHALYENKRVKLLDMMRVRHCLRRKERLDFDYIYKTVTRRGWLDGFSFFALIICQLEEWLYGSSLFPVDVRENARKTIQKKSWLADRLQTELNRENLDFPFKISFAAGKVMYYKKILGDLERPFLTRLHDVIATLAWGIKLKLGIRGQRGMIVSLSGIDGAGKTLHSQALLDAFRTADIISCLHWSRFGSVRRMPSDKVESNHEISTSDSLQRRRNKLRNPILRLGWLVMNLGITCLTFGFKLRFWRRFGGVIVCDRYIYDAIIEIKHSLPDNSELAKFAKQCLVFFCPVPDISWLLDAAGYIAANRQINERGSEIAAQALENQRADYVTLAGRFGLKILSTSYDPEQTTTILSRDTLREYFKNYHTLINGLLLSNPSQMNPR